MYHEVGTADHYLNCGILADIFNENQCAICTLVLF